MRPTAGIQCSSAAALDILGYSGIYWDILVRMFCQKDSPQTEGRRHADLLIKTSPACNLIRPPGGPLARFRADTNLTCECCEIPRSFTFKSHSTCMHVVRTGGTSAQRHNTVLDTVTVQTGRRIMQSTKTVHRRGERRGDVPPTVFPHPLDALHRFPFPSFCLIRRERITHRGGN